MYLGGEKAWSIITGIKSSSKYEVIHNAVDVKKIDREAYVGEPEGFRTSFNLDENDKRVCMSARLHLMKGHRYLIEAAPYIREKVPNVRFLMLGDGPLEKELKEMVKKEGLSDMFIFTGFRQDVPKILSICDIVVFPSIFKENFSFAALEAMACRKPVIVTSVGGFPEMVEDGVTGFVIPPHNSEELAKKAVILLQNDTLAKNMGEAGRLRVEDFFTLEKMLEKTYALYESVSYRIFS